MQADVMENKEIVYSGKMKLTDEELAQAYEGNDVGLLTNQYVTTESGELLRFDGKELVHLSYPKFGKDFRPKNDEQRMAFDLLQNERIPVKVLSGIAGSGKTKMMLKTALEDLKSGHVNKIVIVRQPSPVGEDIGFIKGDKATKLGAWVKPIYDNADFGEFEIDALIHQNRIEIDSPAFMQGRDLHNTAILTEEAQLLTRNQVKMLGSRLGEGGYIVFAGDYDQIFSPKYAGSKNGFIHMMNTFKGDPDFGFVRLEKSVRSRVSEKFATIM